MYVVHRSGLVIRLKIKYTFPTNAQCYDFLSKDCGLDPWCRLCLAQGNIPAPVEDICHILMICRATANTRSRILPEVLNTVAKSFPTNKVLSTNSKELLTQFMLDQTSLNLPNNFRIQTSISNLHDILSMCCNFIYAIHKDHTRKLSQLGHMKPWQLQQFWHLLYHL